MITPTTLVKKVKRPDQASHHIDQFYGCDLYIPIYNLLIKKKQEVMA